MALVAYSDSEGSESEQPQITSAPTSPKRPPPPTSSSSKPTFPKVVDRSDPHKIRVSLPESSDSTNTPSTNAGDAAPEDGPPAKRAKTNGAFTGFNSFLPPPQNAGKPLSSRQDSGSSFRGPGLGRGVNLKTGAAPAFSRETHPPEQAQMDGNHGGQNAENGESLAKIDRLKDSPEPEVKLVGKVNMFKPLSVSRKSQKKKPTAKSVASKTAYSTSNEKTASGSTTRTESKLSLFSATQDQLHETRENPTSGGYEPILLHHDDEDYAGDESNEIMGETDSNAYGQSTAAAPAQNNKLSDLADNLGLSESQRRQLFGRSGKPGDAQVAQFSLAEEYAHNQEQIANQKTTPMHNPVRSIAPGKHSLQQMVNAATNQTDALEESFAEGRRNKKAAGSKYGW